MKIDRLDHLVLTVASIDATVDFYTRVLGMDLVVFSEGRKALAFGRQQINLHERGREFEPKAIRPTPGSADLCFIAASDLREVAARLAAMGVAIVEVPVDRAGATGPIRSIYIRDPDGNLIEIANDRPGQLRDSESSETDRTG